MRNVQAVGPGRAAALLAAARRALRRRPGRKPTSARLDDEVRALRRALARRRRGAAD